MNNNHTQQRNIKIFNINENIENIENIEKENINLIKEEKSKREQFINNLNTKYDVVLIAGGPSLDKVITRSYIKEKFKNKINRNFYIIPVNHSWLYCDDFDFCFASDEMLIPHFLKYNKNKMLITSAYSQRIDYNTRGTNTACIPYCFYKKQANNMLCLFNSGETIRNYRYGIINNLPEIRHNGGGKLLEFVLRLDFKNIFLIGYGGVGYTKLTPSIPLPPSAALSGFWLGNYPLCEIPLHNENFWTLVTNISNKKSLMDLIVSTKEKFKIEQIDLYEKKRENELHLILKIHKNDINDINEIINMSKNIVKDFYKIREYTPQYIRISDMSFSISDYINIKNKYTNINLHYS